MKVFIRKLSPDAIIPAKSEDNAGYDLFAIHDVLIEPGQRRLIKTGVSFSIPRGFYGHISDRSGMAFKNGGHCLGKIIDPSYRGEIGIVLLNTDKQKSLFVQAGDRPAQILFKKYENVEFEEVENLDESARGEKGWGSSGV